MANLTHKTTKPIKKNDLQSKYRDLRDKHNFYKIKKDKENMFQGIVLNKSKVVDKIKAMNIFRFDKDIETTIYIKLIDNLIEEISPAKIVDEFEKYVLGLENYTFASVYYKDDEKGKQKIDITPKMIREAMYEKLSEYFSKAILQRLTPIEEIKIKTDTMLTKYFYYENGFIEISAKGYKFLKYDKLDGKIWKNQRLNRKFKEDKIKGNFEKFIERLAGYKGKSHTDLDDKILKRKKSLQTIIGYCLHSFFFRELKLVVLTDSVFSDDDEANGRTGKGLLCDGLSYMVNADPFNSRLYVEIDGKKIKEKGKHVFEKCNLETHIVHINDIFRNATIETFYNIIFKGIEVDQKNKNPFTIFSKIIISTNKTIKISGPSDKDRVLQFEMSDYFNENHKPSHEYKQWFFRDWDETEFNRFDTFMINSCVEFFKNDLIEPESLTLERRMLIEHTNRHFIDFIEDFIKSGNTYFIDTDGRNDIKTDIDFNYNTKINKKDLYLAFQANYKTYFNRFPTQHLFTKWLREYSKYNKNIDSITKNNNTEGRAGGEDWIIFQKIEKND